eukprot:GILJ01003628.1.p1 GENE.GILJ01003628.1~~GILJ01003628.1.p1  ORF type:complete len:570 (-),score=98.09 GILJ01003628.1:214-1770(-)
MNSFPHHHPNGYHNSQMENADFVPYQSYSMYVNPPYPYFQFATPPIPYSMGEYIPVASSGQFDRQTHEPITHVDSLSSGADMKSVEILRLREALDEANKKMNLLEHEQHRWNAMRVQLEKDAQTSTKSLKASELKIKQLEEQSAQQKKSLDDSRHECRALGDELRKVSAEKDNLHSEISQLKQTLGNASSNIEEHAALAEQLQQAKQQVADYEKRIEADDWMRQKMADHFKTVVRSQVENFIARYSRQFDSVKHTEAPSAGFRGLPRGGHPMKPVHDDHIDDDGTAFSDVDSRASLLEEENEQLKSSLEEAQTKLRSLEAQLHQQNVKQVQLEQDNKGLEQDNARLADQVARCKLTIQQLTAQVQVFESTRAAMQNGGTHHHSHQQQHSNQRAQPRKSKGSDFHPQQQPQQQLQQLQQQPRMHTPTHTPAPAPATTPSAITSTPHHPAVNGSTSTVATSENAASVPHSKQQQRQQPQQQQKRYQKRMNGGAQSQPPLREIGRGSSSGPAHGASQTASS